MKYSYIKPREKTVLTSELKLLLTFFSMTIGMLLITYIFLLYKDYSFVHERVAMTQKKEDFNNSITTMKEQIRFIEAQNSLSGRVYTQNSVLKESISNLFDLVPQRIILSEASLLEKGLILYGITPSKDVYNFMLQAPLRSIFHKTYSSFYPAKNGWYRFVSTNIIEESGLDKQEDGVNEKN